MLKAPIHCHDMVDHFGQLHLGSPQSSPSLTKQQHSFCRPTFSRVGRVSAPSSLATPALLSPLPSFFLPLPSEATNGCEISPPSTPSHGDLLKPEPNNGRLGPRPDQDDALRQKDQNNNSSMIQQQEQEQSSSVSSWPVRPTFTRIGGPRTPKQSATFPPSSSLLSPSSSSSPMPLGSPKSGGSICSYNSCRLDGFSVSASSPSPCSPSLSLSLSLSPSPARSLSTQPSSGWYTLSPLPLSLATSPSSTLLVEPNEYPFSSASTASTTAPPSSSFSPTNALEDEPGTKEGSLSVSASGDVPVAASEVPVPTCSASQPGRPLSFSGTEGSTQTSLKGLAFHRERLPSPPPPIYPTYSCLTLKGSANYSSAIPSAATSSSSHSSAGTTPLTTCVTSAALTAVSSISSGSDNRNSSENNTTSSPQDFLIEADLPYPAPTTLQERQARQRKRAEQLRQLKAREEREARDRRRSISMRRRGSLVSSSLSSPVTIPLSKSVKTGGSQSARTSKVGFDLRRTKIFEYDATGGDWDTLTIRTVIGSPASPVSPVSPVSPGSLCSLFSPPWPSSPSMEVDTYCATNHTNSSSSSAASQSSTAKASTSTQPPLTDVEMEMTV